MDHSSNGLECVNAHVAIEITVAMSVGHRQSIATVIGPTYQRPIVVCVPINLN
jgi:hypothetical protein